ncbi:Glyoxalase/bleomycin resistance protein/dioxygenase [Sphingobium chlorophenolicum L-1]|uniref:Glyoxalase/bleomycin resistance protein/dioxygenase n=1 Tax=Sphingobium chlorophenolicum L-1 TaxID=690566 RepID=F6F3N3_SPHCR|nr:VOC family protein [Sphingobium chlorophenolicum]AEG51045.1 Glyoxalase/bleomycin resistance protein/dioxygenase [Sphingobium chlorophenolicum L-1]
MENQILTPEAGLPGLRGAEHIGFTVPDIEEAVRFFVDVIGCEVAYELQLTPANGNWMETHLNVHPDAAVEKIAFLTCGNGPNLEIFQYSAPDQRRSQPRNSDIGGHHVAFYVHDLDKAVEYLRGKDVVILGEPTDSKGPSEGQRWVYFLTPWGMQLELVSYPQGKAYQKR